MRLLPSVLVVLALASPALAEYPAPDTGAPYAAEPDAPAAADASDGTGKRDAAWELYAEAFDAYLKGDTAAVDSLLARVRREHPNHPAAARAKIAEELLAKREEKRRPQPPARPEPIPEPPATRVPPQDLATLLRDEQPTALARAELTILQTFHGVGLGTQFCGLLECDDPRGFVLAAMMGGGIGLGLSLSLTSDGITPGHALAINSGTGWGLWHGIALGAVLDVPDRTMSSLLMATQLTGLALGHVAWDALRPGAGDVSLANSIGIWSGVLMLMMNEAVDGVSGDDTFGAMLVATDLGLAAGTLLASRFPMSRSRTLILDAGGIAGMLLGFGIGVLVDQDPSEEVMLSLGSLGAVSGLVAAAAFTSEWDLPEPPPARVSLVPTQDGAMLALTYTH